MYDLIPILQKAAETEAIYKVASVEVVGDPLEFTYKILSCNLKTYWITSCTIIQIGGVTGEVIEVENNSFIIVKLESEIGTDIKEFPVPFGTFIHGTLPMAEIEINELGFECLPMPAIYFQEIYTESLQTLESANEFIAENIRIYFLNDYQQDNNMLTRDHYSNIINQMKNYALFFKENLRKDLRVDYNYIDNNTQRIIKRVKAGEYQKGGNIIATFGRNLSGVEFNISIAVKKDNRCGDC